jgi:hypothetical protein
MRRMQTLAFVSVIAVLGAAPPVLAQSFTSVFGTGNTASAYYDQNGVLQVGSPGARQSELAGRQSGESAFAMVPEVATSPHSPALTGGGSIGYNEKLLHD